MAMSETSVVKTSSALNLSVIVGVGFYLGMSLADLKSEMRHIREIVELKAQKDIEQDNRINNAVNRLDGYGERIRSLEVQHDSGRSYDRQLRTDR